ncbi:MAG: DALR anticodon-binding domain-containing protein, partial [Chroococcales cyanobacterium]
GYDIQLTAAMQCLGYTLEQFQCISVQPLKIFAFHKPTQKICAIPNLPIEELLKAVSMNALRWYSLRVPLTSIAPIDITIAGQYHPKNSLYRVQFAYLRCCKILQDCCETSLLEHPEIEVTSYLEKSWNSPESEALANTLKATPEIIQQSANEIAPHLVISHLETISDRCHPWLDNFALTPENRNLLLATQYILFDLMVNLLEIKLHKM